MPYQSCDPRADLVEFAARRFSSVLEGERIDDAMPWNSSRSFLGSHARGSRTSGLAQMDGFREGDLWVGHKHRRKTLVSQTKEEEITIMMTSQLVWRYRPSHIGRAVA